MLNQLTISELVAKLAKREVSSRDSHAGVPGPDSSAWTARSTRSSVTTRRMRWRRPTPRTRRWPRAGTTRATAVARRAGRHQGRHRRQRPAAQLRLEDSRQLHFALRRDGDRETEGGRRGRFRAVEHGRVCDGQFDGELRFQVTRNPWDTTRIPGGSSGGSAAAVAADEVHRGAGLGHRRLDSPAGGAVRLRGSEAHLRPRLALRPGGLRVVARPDRLVRQRRARRGDDAAASSAAHDPRDSTSVPQPVPDYAAALDRRHQGAEARVCRRNT